MRCGFDLVTLVLALMFIGQCGVTYLFIKNMFTDFSGRAFGLFISGLVGFAGFLWPVVAWFQLESSEAASIRRYSYALLIGIPLAALATAIPAGALALSHGFGTFCLLEIPCVIFAVIGYYSARSFANEVSVDQKEDGRFTALPNSSL